MKNTAILFRTIGVTAISAIIMGIIQTFSKITVPYAPNNVLFSVVWGIIIIMCGVNAYLMSVSICGNDAENAVTAMYIQLMCCAVWNLLFFAYGNNTLAVAVSIALLAVCNVSTVLFKRAGTKYCVATLLIELWAIFIVFISITQII